MRSLVGSERALNILTASFMALSYEYMIIYSYIIRGKMSTAKNEKIRLPESVRRNKRVCPDLAEKEGGGSLFLALFFEKTRIITSYIVLGDLIYRI